MALKKTNLSPELKSRLRRAVLGEIEPGQSKKATAASVPIADPAPSVAPVKRPALKSLNKIQAVTKPKPVADAAASEAVNEAKPAIAAKPTPTKKKSIIGKSKGKIKPIKKPTAKKSSLKNKRAAIAETVTETEAVPVAAPITGKSFYGQPARTVQSWERPAANEPSLESLFSSPKPSPITKTGGFFKKPTAGAPIAIPTSAAKPKSKISLFGKDKEAVLKTRKPAVVLLKLIGLLLLVLAVLAGFDVLGIYQLGFRDKLSYQVAKTLKLPAGSVNGRLISATDYINDLQSLNLAFSQKREGVIDYSAKADIKDKVFYRLAALDIMKSKLSDYKKTVSNQDIDKQMNLLYQQTGGRDQAEKIVQNLYGLNVSQFQAEVLEPMLLRENLQQAIMDDDALEINKAAKKRAEEVLKLAQAPNADFAALAKQYTEDESSINTGGDLGWVVKDQLDARWGSLIFNASSSTVVPQLVKSNFGYHIIKVEQKLMDKNTNTESVKLRHILIKVDVDQYIKGLLDQAKLVKYIK